MSNDKPVASPICESSAVMLLPVGLYESNGVIFELYRGGQPYQPKMIRWERLKTFAVTRQDDLMFHVRVSQAHQEIPSP